MRARTNTISLRKYQTEKTKLNEWKWRVNKGTEKLETSKGQQQISSKNFTNRKTVLVKTKLEKKK